MTTDDQFRRLRDALRDPRKRDTFVQLVLTELAPVAGQPGYEKVSIRPLPTGDALQANYFTKTQHTTKNMSVDEAIALLDLPFRRAHLQTTAGDLHIRITKKGRVLVSEGKPSVTQRPAEPGHDHEKQYPLPADRPSPLLQALDIQTHAGIVRGSRRGKFHQINQFLDILASLPEVQNAKGPLSIVDCGCGAAYLTFAAYHYLRDTRGLDARAVGIDAHAALIDKCNTLRDRLGYEHLAFNCARIGDYRPTTAPQIVLSLHACDTATDEAIALGVQWKARAILAAPCCQHELRDQLANESMHAILRHGVLKGRLADVITDAARAAILRMVGYKCEVVEFVSPEHTGKNLLLRAERRSSKPLPGAAEDYAALKAAWRIEPALERLLHSPA